LDGPFLREQSRLHRTVDADAGAVTLAPLELVRGGVASHARERRLERVDVTDRLAAGEQCDVGVGHTCPADLALIREPRHLAPGILDGHTGLIGPVELIEIDALDAEPSE